MSILDDAYQARRMKELPPEPLTNLHIKPAPDSAVWWQEVAQGLGITIRDVRAERDKLRAALVGLVGVDGREELEAMEGVMRLMPAPAEDKAATINAIHALLATCEPAQAADAVGQRTE